MPYKTLILVDNSDTLSSLNREIISQTIKYILLNASEDNSFSIACVGQGTSYLTDYEDSLDTKVKSVGYIEYDNKTLSYKDALMEVLTEWRENDFAGRDIILISDGHETENSYTAEELFFELNDGEYPVYAIECVQEDNTAGLKSMSSIARISKGAVFMTEFENSDAAVEEKIGQGILDEMEEYRQTHEKKYISEETGEESDLSEYENEFESQLADKIFVENEYQYSDGEYDENESVIYEMPARDTDGFPAPLYILPVMAVIIIVCFAYGAVKRRKRERAEEEQFIKRVKSSISVQKTDEKGQENINEASFMDTGVTRSLSVEYEEEDGGTRLLYQSQDGVDITLEDRADPTKYFRACIRDRLVIGRSKNLCDVALAYDDSVSSRHCELFLRGNDLYVRDLSSSNGTCVNQQKVYQEIKLHSGDILKLGQLSLYVQILRREAFAGI